MSILHLWIAFSIVSMVILWNISIKRIQGEKVDIGRLTIPLLFLLALTLRVVLAISTIGFEADFNCFSSWSDRMFLLGPSKFYAKDYFSDYPPLYLYVLYFLGLVKHTFGIISESPAHLLLMKSPAILSDLLIGYVIYKVGNKRVGLASALCLSALFLFQPAVLINSAVWGQVDSLFTLFLIMSCLFLEHQNLFPAMLFFALGTLMKPQMLIFAPVMILGVLTYVFRGSFSMRMLTKALAYALLTLLFTILLAMPFGMENVISQYVDTLGSYPYASVNAYNFWSGVGLNWVSQTTMFCGFPCKTWSYIAIVLATAFSIILGLRLGTISGKFFDVAAFLILTVFTFAVRMHERYLYPFLPLAILGFMGFASRQLISLPAGTASKKEQKRTVGMLSKTLRVGYPIIFMAVSLLHLYNTGYVLYFYDPKQYSFTDPWPRIAGLAMTIAALGYYLLIFHLQTKKETAMTYDPNHLRQSHKAIRILPEQKKMTRLDLLLLLFITLLYSCFALRDLGDTKAPESLRTISKQETLSFTFPNGQKAVKLAYYIAPEHNRQFLAKYYETTKSSSAEPDEKAAIELKNVFCWKEIDFPIACQRVEFVLQGQEANLIELYFMDADGNHVIPENSAEYPELFDEAELHPDRYSFRNGTYFDEIYHARTAYEFLHGMRSYENTHPPLGKILISLGIMVFGMNPFGWRIIGTLFGIAMLPFMYLFVKRLTGDTPASALACFIFAFDFMHFTQTRIATIDVYIVFFILCMYYFLYRFLSTDFASAPLKNLLISLGLCGFCMGLGISCKWTGVYAGLGMGLLFFLHLGLLIRKSTEGQPLKKFWGTALGGRVIKVVCCCVIFFVVVPLIIYLLSYLPFRDSEGNGLLARAIKNQTDMFSYHSKLKATHSFASPFYEWPLIIRPIWYYYGTVTGTLRESISAFGNPLVWWVGLPALVYMIYLLLRRRDRRAGFLIVGYLSQYLPWFFVTRLTFIYHYFPSVIFLVLMISYGFRNLKESLPKKAYVPTIVIYSLFVFALFLMFYPVLSGQAVEISYLKKQLTWFDKWIFATK